MLLLRITDPLHVHLAVPLHSTVLGANDYLAAGVASSLGRTVWMRWRLGLSGCLVSLPGVLDLCCLCPLLAWTCRCP